MSDTKTAPMRIVKLEVSNVKRVFAVEIIPGPHSVTLKGQNEQGKSSVLDAIEMALSGGRAICDKPLREGAKSGYVVDDLGDIIVKRTFTASGGTSLKVENKEGVTLSRPQDLLDGLCAKVAFDPLEFVRLKPQDQAETLRKLVGLDFSKHDADKKKHYDDRTVVNRNLAQKKAALAGMELISDAPDKEISMQELVNKLNDARAHNKKITDIDTAIKDSNDESMEIQADINKIVAEIEQLQSRLESKRAALKQSQEFSSQQTDERAKMTPIDETAISAEMSTIETSNAKFRKAERRKEVKREVDDLQAQEQALTKKIDDIDEFKNDLVAKAKFPIDGLSFDEVGVLLNKLPFNQGSRARQLQASVAIGMALNPTVRVILIRDAAVLDEESTDMITKMAVEKDYQVWFEKIVSDDNGAIEIVDGKVKE
jgi:hypothetical protein